MDKKNYYVSVHSKSIMYHQGDAAYEFEIVASEEDADKLKNLFEDLEQSDESAFFRAHHPGIPYHHDEENDRYDSVLKEIYGLIHDLGTDQTKSHIESMNLQMGAAHE
ncbi:hypothetical protein [Cohnella yongneupensis]|uniref:Hydrolase n=1 Tax=Cohnella yongneupensis TaxID=425006 RepID=A0ABW0QVN7_9BACL